MTWQENCVIMEFIVDAVEKKYLLLFNLCGDGSPHWPQSGLASDFRTCIHSRGCRLSEGFFRQARRIFAGILCVLQENSTQHGGKRPGQTAFEVVNTGSYSQRTGSARQRPCRCLKIGIYRFSSVLTIQPLETEWDSVRRRVVLDRNIFEALVEGQRKAVEQYHSSVDFIQGICGEFKKYTQIVPDEIGRAHV